MFDFILKTFPNRVGFGYNKPNFYFNNIQIKEIIMFSFFKRKKPQQPVPAVEEQHETTEHTEAGASVLPDSPKESEESFDIDLGQGQDRLQTPEDDNTENNENPAEAPNTQTEETLEETAEQNPAVPQHSETVAETTETVTETTDPAPSEHQHETPENEITDHSIISIDSPEPTAHEDNERANPTEIPEEAFDINIDLEKAQSVSDSPESEKQTVESMLSVEGETIPAEPSDAPVDEFEIDSELLGDNLTENPLGHTAEAMCQPPIDINIESQDEEIKETIKAMQEAWGGDIFDFSLEQPAEQENTETNLNNDNNDETIHIGFYDTDDSNPPAPLVLPDDAETIDAQTVEAEMLAIEEAAGKTPAFADIAANKVSDTESEPELSTAEESKAESDSTSSDMAYTESGQTVLEPTDKIGWAERLKQGLAKSRNHMAKSLASVFGGGQIDEDLYEELETVLLTSDMGIEATEQLMNEVRRRVSLRGLSNGTELRQALKDAVYDLLKPLEQPLCVPAPTPGKPFVIMVAGINGAGKTTSIGKLAKYFQAQGKSVVLAAGDTFRAAAREQLQEWGKRNGVMVVSQASGDSAAVCFDAVEAAKARKIDIVLADTAGRLPTQLHLMEEIKKVKRVLQKSIPDAPHEIIVVLDANIGQNALNQVKAFDDALDITGLIVTKLDGTAKGGVLGALSSHYNIPVRYIGVGEKIDDLRPFDTQAFVEALFDEDSL